MSRLVDKICFIALLLAVLNCSCAIARVCQCTDYVAEKFNLGSGWGDAKNWGPFLTGKSWVESDIPSVGAVVVQQPCFGNGVNSEYGHVGWVSAWNGKKFSITGANQHQCSLGTVSWNSGCRTEGTCEGVSDWYNLPVVAGCVKFYTRGSAPATAAPSPIPASSYMGCFIDALQPERDLRGPTRADAAMTIASCRSWCAQQGYAYAGLQYATQCFCDQDYGRYGRAAADSECAMPCAGAATERCGNAWRNSVYRTDGTSNNNVPPITPPPPAPTPATSAAAAGLCTTAALRLRSCASVSCAVRTTIPFGQRVSDLGQPLQHADGMFWRHVSYQGVSGWSAEQYLARCATFRLDASSIARDSIADEHSLNVNRAAPPAWIVPVCVLAAIAVIVVTAVAVLMLLVVLPRREAQQNERKQLNKILFESIVEPPMGYRSSFTASG